MRRNQQQPRRKSRPRKHRRKEIQSSPSLGRDKKKGHPRGKKDVADQTLTGREQEIGERLDRRGRRVGKRAKKQNGGVMVRGAFNQIFTKAYESKFPEAKEMVATTEQPVETVNHPNHYNVGKIEVIDAIEDWGLNFNLGNAVKYIARAPHKGKQEEDLKKALWYIQRELGGNRK